MLSGEPRQERTMSDKNEALHQKRWVDMTPKERDQYERSLETLSVMRRAGKSLEEAASVAGIPVDKVLNSIAPAFLKKGNRWQATEYDTLTRPPMNIIEDGQLQSIVVNDSREASKIGRYFSAVGIYLDKADPRPLLEFQDVRVRDADGNWHSFETNPRVVEEVVRRSEPEAPEPYKYAG